MWSTVVASLAVNPGFRNVLAATSSPSLARVVTAASAASVVQPSSLPSSGSPSSDSRWSSTHRLSAPARSAASDRVAQARASPCAGSRTLRRSGSGGGVGGDCIDRCYARAMVVNALVAPSPTPYDGLRDAILAWYDARGRSLPFRGTTDPYAVLVSEVMAQQTQISRVGPAWTAFMATFPTIADLAAATPADVLRAWRGMGYNRRALNLWRVARTVVDEHGGRSAVGRGDPRATAGDRAIHGTRRGSDRVRAPVGAVDTNVRRVLGRAVGGAIDAFPASELQRVADASSRRTGRPTGPTRSWTLERRSAGRRDRSAPTARPQSRAATLPTSRRTRALVPRGGVSRRPLRSAAPRAGFGVGSSIGSGRSTAPAGRRSTATLVTIVGKRLSMRSRPSPTRD